MAEDFNMDFSMDAAKKVIDDGIAKATDLINDPAALDELIGKLDQKILGLPETVKSGFAGIPTMVSMVKGYITKEYTEVSPKVIATLVSAFLYLVSKKDLIRDDIPLLGFIDDLAVIAIAMKICEPELEAFKLWAEQNAPAGAAPAEA